MNKAYRGTSRGISPFGQLGIFIGLVGAGFILASLVTVLMIYIMLGVPLTEMAAAVLDPKNIQVARFVQFASTFFLFALPAFIFAIIVNTRPVQFLGFSTHFNLRQFYIVLLIVIAALFAQSTISQVNEMIPIPQSWELKFKQMEDDYAKQVLSMAHMTGFGDYLFALIILAFLPAVFEEMFFRGALQQVLTGLFRNAFWGILLTSIFFSAAHFSFYGFLTRMFLGLLLGYIFYYSKNIWLNITAHFLNNAVVVTGLYMLSRNGNLTEKSLEDENYPVYVGILAILAVFALFVFFKRESMKTVLVTHDGETEEYQLKNFDADTNDRNLPRSY